MDINTIKSLWKDGIEIYTKNQEGLLKAIEKFSDIKWGGWHPTQHTSSIWITIESNQRRLTEASKVYINKLVISNEDFIKFCAEICPKPKIEVSEKEFIMAYLEALYDGNRDSDITIKDAVRRYHLIKQKDVAWPICKYVYQNLLKQKEQELNND